ncbi:RluA family pseudouridine synthase [Myroides sp. LJL116]
MSCTLPLFRSFKADISSFELPEKFTYPFFYQPDPISVLASQELMQELKNDPQINALFDPESAKALPCGKMFGILVVKDPQGKIGYLAGFSGKLGPFTHVEGFVPSIFDLYNKEGFFLQEELVLNQINQQISLLEKQSNLDTLEQELQLSVEKNARIIEDKKQELKQLKQQRKQLRLSQRPLLTQEQFAYLEEDLVKQSLRDKHQLRVLTQDCQKQIQDLEAIIAQQKAPIEALKESRKNKSNALQQKLFKQYQFLNNLGQTKDLLDIFKDTAFKKPPAAAGDCAAPRLLQYAYAHQMHPIAMAEFWWGESPKSEIRKHLNYYPACKGKCEPILNHMLQGLSVEDNPLLEVANIEAELEIVYQDQDIAIVNKPHEFLSVPGIYIKDSVFTRMQKLFGKTDSPLIVHRLDMATSGILIIAKTKKAHKALQKQFLEKTVEKTYVALVEGHPTYQESLIDLPLILDIEDRPRQKVCYTHGKPSLTKWEIVAKNPTNTKVLFYPITGRTHQLRMHASHPLGLNCPIVGDDLYGTKDNRLYLHAKKITFIHPTTKEVVSFEIEEDF